MLFFFLVSKMHSRLIGSKPISDAREGEGGKGQSLDKCRSAVV